jgi:hypothetical protein
MTQSLGFVNFTRTVRRGMRKNYSWYAIMLMHAIHPAQVLDNPVEINVGGRSVVNKDITQVRQQQEAISSIHLILLSLSVWTSSGTSFIGPYDCVGFLQTQFNH